MAQRSLNKVQLIGNLTRDPELRYTPQGTAVCTFGLATNRFWTTEAGEKKEEVEFHRVVTWNKLAELCSQLLFKGRKVYVEGRLQTRRWTGNDGNPRQSTEIVADEMFILDSRRAPGEAPEGETIPEEPVVESAEAPALAETPAPETPAAVEESSSEPQEKPVKKAAKAKKEEGEESPEVKPEDIPF